MHPDLIVVLQHLGDYSDLRMVVLDGYHPDKKEEGPNISAVSVRPLSVLAHFVSADLIKSEALCSPCSLQNVQQMLLREVWVVLRMLPLFLSEFVDVKPNDFLLHG